MMSKITYHQVGDYLIPNLKLPPEEERGWLGKRGMIHKSYIEKHNKVLFSSLLDQNQLEWVQRMNSIQQQAKEIVCNELIYT